MAAEVQTIFGGNWKERKAENMDKVLSAMGMQIEL